MGKNLKLYVWEDVLTDYTSGMVCILAKDLEDAKEVFMKKYPDDGYVLKNFFGEEHEVITEPEAFYVYGGG